MDILSSPLFSRIFGALIFKSNLDKERVAIVEGLRKRGYRDITLNYVPKSATTTYPISSKFELADGKLIKSSVTVDDVLCLFIFYLDECTEGRYQVYSPYPAANMLAGYEHPADTEVLEHYKDKTLEQICIEHPSIGCKFQMNEIKNRFPNYKEDELKLLYRLSNSIGEIKPLEDFKQGELKIFSVDKREKLKESIAENRTEDFRKALDWVNKYFEYKEDEILTVVSKSKLKYFEAIVKSLSPENNQIIRSSYICQGGILSVFDSFRNKDQGPENIVDFIRRYNKQIAPILNRLFSTNLIIDDSKFIKSGVLKTQDLLSITELIKPTLDQINQNLNNVSVVRKLSPKSKNIISHAIERFFGRKFGITDPDVCEALALLFFSFMTTSPYIRKRNEYFEVNFSINNQRRKLGFYSSEFISYLDSYKNELDYSDRGRNYLRLFCSARANLAIAVNYHFGYKPKLFANSAIIPDHMRIDFWKGLDVKHFNKEEQEGYDMLQRVTDYHSNRDEPSRIRYYEALERF